MDPDRAIEILSEALREIAKEVEAELTRRRKRRDEPSDDRPQELGSSLRPISTSWR